MKLLVTSLALLSTLAVAQNATGTGAPMNGTSTMVPGTAAPGGGGSNMTTSTPPPKGTSPPMGGNMTATMPPMSGNMTATMRPTGGNMTSSMPPTGGNMTSSMPPMGNMSSTSAPGGSPSYTKAPTIATQPPKKTSGTAAAASSLGYGIVCAGVATLSAAVWN